MGLGLGPGVGDERGLYIALCNLSSRKLNSNPHPEFEIQFRRTEWANEILLRCWVAISQPHSISWGLGATRVHEFGIFPG